MWQNRISNTSSETDYEMKGEKRGVGSLTGLSPGTLIIYASSFTFLFWFLTFFVSLFHFFLCALSPLCHLSPLLVPCNATDGLWERWGDHRGFLSIWPHRALHLPLTAWSITHKCFLLLFGSRLPAQGSTRSLWAPVIITLGLCWEEVNIPDLHSFSFSLL